MKENKFQSDLKKELRERFPGSMVLKLDPNDIQGIPDLLLLYKNKWAALEVKKDKDAKHRPNQDYYVDKLGSMSYAAFICPENKEEILNEISRSFSS